MSGQGMLTVADLGDDHPGLSFLTGRTPFFAYQGDQRFSYALYVPPSYSTGDRTQQLLVTIHGTRRRAEATLELFTELADASGCALLAPLFPAGIGDPNDLDTYKVIEQGGVRYDEVLLGMVTEVQHRWKIDVERFHLYGFSGGGQFAHRFLYLHPQRLASVSIGSPGRATLLDSSLNWPDGTADLAARFGVEANLEALRLVPVQVFVGGDDTAIRSGEPGGERSRRDRALGLTESLRAAGCDVTHEIVPGVGHSSAATAHTAARFLDTQLRARRRPRDAA